MVSPHLCCPCPSPCVVLRTMFQVVANGGMYDRSLPFSPSPHPTPNNTAQDNSYSELMKLLSPQVKHLSRKSTDVSPSLHGMTKLTIANTENFDDFSSYKLEQMSPEGLRRLSEHMLLEKSERNDSFTHGCDDNKSAHAGYAVNGDDDIKKLKRRPIVDLNESLLNMTDPNATMSSHCLLRLFSPDKDNFVLPSMGSGTNISVSTTASSKKRSRNSAESNFEVEILNGDTPKAVEENNWKSPFKRLKIKDSFRFKGKDKPVICKTLVKKKKSKNEEINDDEDKDVTDYMTSTPSPRKDEDNISMCSISSTAKADRSFFSSSGLFDISFCSLRGGKTAKSVSKIRRSMKSLTASFRGERKKKYEKRTKDSDSEDDDLMIKNIDMGKSSPRSTKALTDDSPVENKTPLTRISENNELESSAPHFDVSPLIFKTPMGKPKRQASSQANSPYPCGYSPQNAKLPVSGAAVPAFKLDQSRVRRPKQERPALNHSLLSVLTHLSSLLYSLCLSLCLVVLLLLAFG